MALKALQDKFNKAMADANAIRAKYAGKSESMTPDEERQFDALLDEAREAGAVGGHGLANRMMPPTVMATAMAMVTIRPQRNHSSPAMTTRALSAR